MKILNLPAIRPHIQQPNEPRQRFQNAKPELPSYLSHEMRNCLCVITLISDMLCDALEKTLSKKEQEVLPELMKIEPIANDLRKGLLRLISISATKAVRGDN